MVLSTTTDRLDDVGRSRKTAASLPDGVTVRLELHVLDPSEANGSTLIKTRIRKRTKDNSKWNFVGGGGG
ncbi:hypothetical protein L596_013501 [Steinernema carpocapsae]|uniref:Uncharacterized protein n=1 Tax=Steinernema carpocapsae TaxID=34508 RepID=A0A4U5P179_STECR|nr:hypothetical protein L596_013501 [Steinernema carpocapsae]